jgi:DNA-binding Lrp family transcriptional regulator
MPHIRINARFLFLCLFKRLCFIYFKNEYDYYLLNEFQKAKNSVCPMKKPRLDDIDLKILHILQTNGRVTNVELARQAGISAPPCLRRVRALEKAGFITGYFAELDAHMLGLGVTVFAMVGLESQAETDLQAFEALVAAWPEVLECHMLNGEIDFILKCIAPDLESFQDFLTQKLTPAPNVANVRTSLTIRRSKGRTALPIGEAT